LIVDTSALLAIVFAEPGYEVLVRRLTEADGAAMGAPSVTEASLVLFARLGSKSHGLMERLLAEFRIEVIPYSDVHVSAATEAFRRFGKGRHRASLNFGDCMAYAIAKLADAPLLYVGDDFSHTDIASAA
jgi:ribonuclease VapC